MTAATLSSSSPLPTQKRRQLMPHAVLGTVVFVITELMFFAGLISAHSIVKLGTVGGWPPDGQPRLPLGETLINTTALLMSGAMLFVAMRVAKKHHARATGLVTLSIALGAFFILLQGREWLALISEGLTLTSSAHGSFFYLIVGAHALHAVAGLATLVYLLSQMRKQATTPGTIGAAQIYWYFVVLLWPVLYLKVYL